MYSSIRAAVYCDHANRTPRQQARQEETISELEEYLKQGQNPNARDGSATSFLELCIDFKSRLNIVCRSQTLFTAQGLIAYTASDKALRGKKSGYARLG